MLPRRTTCCAGVNAALSTGQPSTFFCLCCRCLSLDNSCIHYRRPASINWYCLLVGLLRSYRPVPSSAVPFCRCLIFLCQCILTSSGGRRSIGSRDSWSIHGERYRTERNRQSTGMHQEMCVRRTRNTGHCMYRRVEQHVLKCSNFCNMKIFIHQWHAW